MNTIKINNKNYVEFELFITHKTDSKAIEVALKRHMAHVVGVKDRKKKLWGASAVLLIGVPEEYFEGLINHLERL